MRGINWSSVVFFTVMHIWGILGIFYLWTAPFATTVLGICCFFVHMLSITAGNHRLYSHKSYDCAKSVQIILVGFSAGSVQKSLLHWAANHRLHHRFADSDRDPYNATHGFWWPHIGWILWERIGPDINDPGLADLRANPVVCFQQKWYYQLMLSFGLLLPTAIASLWGDPFGGIMVTGSRVMLQGHATGLVNSFCHMFGEQSFSPKETARDTWGSFSSIKSFLTSLLGVAVATLTLGEGGKHAFHHRFSQDWRCGWKWYDVDPTRWFIWTLYKLGLAWDLDKNTTPEIKIRAALA